MLDQQEGMAGDQVMLTALLPDHAADAGRLHILGQPGTFLTSLGPEVLTALYRVLPMSEHGFGLAAVASPRPASLIGFVSATSSIGALFAEMGTRRVRTFLPPLARRFVRQPALLARAVQTVFYPLLHGTADPSAPPSGELLSIMVEPAQRGRGVGSLLMTALQAECQRRAIRSLDVTVDAANADAQRFYVAHGFVFVRAFRLYGRKMCLFQARLA